ncbi:MAG: LptF/LptG family permease [Bacteroidetes bacterium]|nr:LptF/LptG family permease [Bacteroidota bacterium]
MRDYSTYNKPYLNFRKFDLDSASKYNAQPASFKEATELLNDYSPEQKIQTMEIAMNKARNVKNYADVISKQMDYKEKNRTSYLIEIYRKFTLSVACLVLFLIGAPLGSIIRRGGLGWPMFYCVLFFILYHATSIIGEKMAENNIFTPFGGMWLSTFVLTPVGLFLTMKATNDSRLYSTEYYAHLFRKLFTR